MIVTIDGPAGAGKSSAARGLADRLGFQFLDTGAMYRAIAYAAIEQGIDLTDADAMEQFAASLQIELSDDQVLVNGNDVTQVIRTQEVTTATRYAADHPAIRAMLVDQQRAMAGRSNYVTEGRDQGTVAFPDAECKIFLTASEQTRGQRRFDDLTERGEETTLEEVLEKQRDRDNQDTHRKVGALAQADDAVVLVSDGLSLDEVVDELYGIVHRKCGL